ncbi:MAG: YceI family protein [Oligoflexus sp.]|nr:YceI family protein [Pseudopedobacter sp.]
MKKIVLTIVALTGLFFAFKPAANVYTVDVSKSKIEWIGKKITGQHKGEIKLVDGTLSANGNKLVGGSFNIDMSTITCTDLDATNGGKLLGHLKSPDFFSVEKNPISNFQITNVSEIEGNKVNITGNLTIKGINNKITFPASVQQKGSFLVAVASGVKVDRTKYEIKYGSKNFIAGLGDKAIDDDFELNINLVAKK